MTKIKICGLTRIGDRQWANKLLPDYIGFVFAPSRRRVTPRLAGEIAAGLDRRIKRVGVFVNPTLEEIEGTLRQCSLDIVQLHGEESPEFCARLPFPVWKAFRIKDQQSLKMMRQYQVQARLLDGYHPRQHGGMSQTFPWEWLRDLDWGKIPLILAGGIQPNNVLAGIAIVKPYAVDVSSGVESAGRKDAEKIEELIRKVRSLDD